MGQTINVTQSFSLYNVAGLLDKDKNIYYVPHKDVIYNKKTTTNKRVCDCYKSLFDEVCPSSSKYTDVVISQWSPEDRILRVNDTIDNFRVSRGNGLALNYVIVKREVVGEGSKPYYYSFFIDSVRQVGANTVELNLSPDYFTNFYYLNNEEELTEDYDAFNPVMRNCYVERQHYDRYEKVGNPIFNGKESIVINKLPNDLKKGIMYAFQKPNDTVYPYYDETLTLNYGYFNLEFRDIDTDEVIEVEIPSRIKKISLYIETEQIPSPLPVIRYVAKGYKLNDNVIDFPNNSYLVVSYNNGALSFEIKKIISQLDRNIIKTNILYKYIYSINTIPANEEVFMNSEESYRFKYQYKDFRIPFVITGSDYSVNDLQEIVEKLKSVSDIHDFYDYARVLPENKKKILVSLLVKYANVTLKENVLSPNMYEGDVDSPHKYGWFKLGKTLLTNESSLGTKLITITRPVIDVNYLFNNLSANKLGIKIDIYQEGEGIVDSFNLPNSAEFLGGGVKGTDQYIYDIFLTKYSYLFNYFSGFAYYSDEDRMYIVFRANIYPLIPSLDNRPHYNEGGATLTNTEPTLSFLPNETDLENYNIEDSEDNIPIMYYAYYDSNTGKYTYSAVDSYFNSHIGLLGFAMPFKQLNDFKFKLPIKEYSIDSYNEPILDTEPYSFYSLSLYENEMVLNKSRYYQTKEEGYYTVKLKLNVSYFDSYKVGLIPFYTINNVELPYYSESLVLTVNASLPISVDSYYQYLYQNKAQMKNQFAVNNYQRGTDLLQRFFNTAPAQVGAGFLGGGEGTGYSQIVKQVSGMIDDGIDWSQSNKVIQMNQKAQLSDMGAKPDTVKQAGSDIMYELTLQDLGIHLNYYTIDDYSYNSIAKLLERTGYNVRRFDELNIDNRIGLNYIKLISFDFVEDTIKISSEQANAISSIFSEGVTLLHDKDFLHNLGETGYHNYETTLKDYEGGDN